MCSQPDYAIPGITHKYTHTHISTHLHTLHNPNVRWVVCYTGTTHPHIRRTSTHSEALHKVHIVGCCGDADHQLVRDAEDAAFSPVPGAKKVMVISVDGDLVTHLMGTRNVELYRFVPALMTKVNHGASMYRIDHMALARDIFDTPHPTPYQRALFMVLRGCDTYPGLKGVEYNDLKALLHQATDLAEVCLLWSD